MFAIAHHLVTAYHLSLINVTACHLFLTNVTFYPLSPELRAFPLFPKCVIVLQIFQTNAIILAIATLVMTTTPMKFIMVAAVTILRTLKDMVAMAIVVMGMVAMDMVAI